MTRKRFIKLVMSKGYSRNYAAGMAEAFSGLRTKNLVTALRAANLFTGGGSYGDLWQFFTESHYRGADAWGMYLRLVADALWELAKLTAEAASQAINENADGLTASEESLRRLVNATEDAEEGTDEEDEAE